MVVIPAVDFFDQLDHRADHPADIHYTYEKNRTASGGIRSW